MTCVERRSRETVPETGRLSDGRVDGVEAARHRVDAIGAAASSSSSSSSFLADEGETDSDDAPSPRFFIAARTPPQS